MVDLAPEGCVSLRDFYELFTSWKWNGSTPLDELQLEKRIGTLPTERKETHRASQSDVTNACLLEAVRLFASESLRTFVILPGGSERRYLSGRAWREAFFPERMFLADTIGASHGIEFDVAAGRTPFVEKAEANDYLSSNGSQRAKSPAAKALREMLIKLVMDGVVGTVEAEDFRERWVLAPMAFRPDGERYDPRRRVTWTLPMVLTWIGVRHYSYVREAMDDYRAAMWEWRGFHHLVPLRDGISFYDVRGSELTTLEPLSATMMALDEADRVASEDDPPPMLTVKSARESLWGTLTDGLLVATAVDGEGKVVQVPRHEWPYLQIEGDNRVRDRIVFTNRRAVEAYRDLKFLQSDVIALWPGRPDPPTPPQFDFERSSWTFLEAAIWVGCKGLEAPSQRVADEDLETQGAEALFAALFRQPNLVATGLNQQRLREPIPSEYWEMATTEPGRARDHHYLSFIDEQLGGYGGQLIPVGQTTPRWFGIQLERDALFRAFPEFAPAKSGGPTTPDTKAEGRKVEVAREALKVLYPDGTPKGLTEKDRLTAVNAWLKVHGHSQVSQRTVARATKL